MNLKKYLKPIKKKFANKNKAFITIKQVYAHLSDYSNEEILDYYNVKSIKELEAHIEHIKNILQKQLENYEEELKELDACFCLDSRGDFKYLYPSKKEAEKQRIYSEKTKHIKLALYSCPYHCGWHLSKI
jgi:spore cortex formation protein SpoVR/YcgB (stage V sporulation)